MRFVRRQALLDLGHLEQLARADQSRQLADERDVLGHVAAELADLRVRLDEALHVGDGLDLAAAGRRRARLVVGHVRLDVRAEVAEVVVEMPCEEGVLLGREHDFLSRQVDRALRRRTLRSSVMSGAPDRSTRPFWIPMSSWTIA